MLVNVNGKSGSGNSKAMRGQKEVHMVNYPVQLEKQKELEERMARLGIEEEDIEEKFVRSSGRGGQKLNKTSSCVSLYHRPSDTLVKCQQSRSQALNRFFARRQLVECIENKISGGQEEEKIRRKMRERKKRRKRRTQKKLNSE